MGESYANINHASYGLTDEEVAAQRTDLLTAPERVRERRTMSTSLIDPWHTYVYHNAGGIILGIPEEDVIITAPHHISTVHGSRRLLEAHSVRWGLPQLSPAELLEQTPKGDDNEVAIAAGNAALLGFFSATYRTRNNLGKSVTRDVDPETARLMSDHAKRLGLPHVRIPSPSRATVPHRQS
jgi:hypothetical protein